MPRQNSVRSMKEQSSFNAQMASSRAAKAAARQTAVIARERNILHREQQVNLAEMELMLTRQQAGAPVGGAPRVAGHIRTHHEINDVGNVEMVDEDDDSI